MEARMPLLSDALASRLAHLPPGIAALYRDLLNTDARAGQARYWEIKATLLELAQEVTSEADFWPQALTTVRHLFAAAQASLWVKAGDGYRVAVRADDGVADLAVPLPLLLETVSAGQVQVAPLATPEGDVRVCLLGPIISANGFEGVLQVVLATPAMRPEQAEELSLTVGQLACALERVRRMERLSFYASHDPLTGLANRRHFEEYVEREFKLAKRHGTPMSLLIVDVDHFKIYNDTYGHPAGDRLLEAIAGALKDAVRSTDFIARLGGEEFVIVLPHTGGKGAVMAAEKVLQSIRSLPEQVEVCGGRVTASIGVATCDGRACAVGSLLESADQAMYRAKQSGRDRVCQALPAK